MERPMQRIDRIVVNGIIIVVAVSAIYSISLFFLDDNDALFVLLLIGVITGAFGSTCFNAKYINSLAPLGAPKWVTKYGKYIGIALLLIPIALTFQYKPIGLLVVFAGIAVGWLAAQTLVPLIIKTE